MRAALAAAAGRMRPRPRVAIEDTPFLPIGQITRGALLFYLFAYRMAFPLLAALSNDGARDLLALRFTAEFFYTCLIAYPFIFYRKEYGWLHPLVLPILWQLGKALAKNPLMLAFPFDLPLVDFTVETHSKAATLSMSNIDLAWTRLELSLVYCLAQATYLGMFLFGPTFAIPRFRLYRPRSVAIPALAFILGMMAMASVFVIAQGGIADLIVAMRGGRHVISANYGQYINAALLAPVIAMAWFGYERRPFLNPFFVGGTVVALLTSLIASGSRASVILPVLGLILLWWQRRGRPLVLPTVAAAMAGILLLSIFGSIRQDWHSTNIDASVFQVSNLGETLQSGYSEISTREDEESALAVMAGAQSKGLLWGRSYLNAAVFWIPRSVWDDKPVGVDFYNMWINFNDNQINSAPRDWGTWGIPVNAEMEAYWNFGLVGVIAVFGLLGMFNATLAKAAQIYRHVPIFWAIYIYTVLNLVGTSKSVVDLIRTLMILIVFMVAAGIIRLSRGSATRQQLSPSAHGS